MNRKRRIPLIWLFVSFLGVSTTGVAVFFHHQCSRQSALISSIRSEGGVVSFSPRNPLFLKWISWFAPPEYCGYATSIEFSRISDDVVFRRENYPKQDVDSILEAVSQINGLQIVRLDNSQFTHVGLVKLARLRNLKELHVCGTTLGKQELDAISQIHSLETLHLYAAKFNPQDLSCLIRLKSLKVLSLCFTDIDDEALFYVGKMSSIKRLDLSHTQISNRGLLHLVGLEIIDDLQLRENDLDDNCVDQLRRMRSLKSLNLQNTGITEKGIARLKNYFPNLNVESGSVLISWR